MLTSLRCVLVAAVTLVQAAPAFAQRGRQADTAIVALPSNRIQRQVTNFSEALSCMDDLFLQYGKKDLKIFASDIPDKTETVKAGTRDMLISAIDRMSIKSSAFTFVDVDVDDRNAVLAEGEVSGMVRPDYYIKGSITAVDQQVTTKSKKGGISFAPVSLGIANDSQVSQVGMDLGVFLVSNRTQMPGVRTSNTVFILQSGKGADLEGLLPFASLLFSVRKDVNEGQGAAVRSLLELSLIELLGKFTKVPYWQCLALPSTDPMALKTATDYFNRMKLPERVAATQTALRASAHYDGQVDGVDSPVLKAAIARYRAENDLGTGVAIDPALYFSFLSKQLPARPDDPKLARPKPFPELEQIADKKQLNINIELPASVAVNEKFRVAVTVNQDAYVYCFMNGTVTQESDQAGAYKVSTAYRIYPNQFTGDQPRTPANQPLVIPSGGFSLAFDSPGREEIGCIARTSPYEDPLPPSVRMTALTDETQVDSRRTPLSPIAAIINEHQARDVRGLNSVAKRVSITVKPGMQ